MVTKAEHWLEVIDAPQVKKGSWAGINRRAVKRMSDAADGVLQDASPRMTDLYVFSDNSGLWEKSKDDWRLADEDTIARVWCLICHDPLDECDHERAEV